jgi:hypothetical protein
MMQTASCHCGAVQIDIAEMPDTLTQCTCSICRRYAALWAYCTTETATVKAAPGATTIYMWNDCVIEFYHCNTCGCMTHYEDVDKSPGSRIAVNARMMDYSADIAGIKIRTFDGADTWQYID